MLAAHVRPCSLITAACLAWQPALAEALRDDHAGTPPGVMAPVIVTAERRPVDAQQVPASVAVLSRTDVEGLSLGGAVELTEAIPGLQFGRQGMGATPFVRGVGAPSGAVGNESPVAVYIDGVYVASPTAAVPALFGVQQIELLKGPQGTLFGRNATGGVIQIQTREPQPDPAYELSVERAQYDRTQGTLYATGGLASALSANVTIHYANQGRGWGTNLTTGEQAFRHEEFGARGKFDWKPTDRTRVVLGWSHASRDGEDGLGYHLRPGSLGLDGSTGFAGFYDSLASAQDRAWFRHRVASIRFEGEYERFRVVNLVSWQELHAFFQLDQDATPASIVDADISQYARTVTEEFQVLSHADTDAQWIAGVYYWKDQSEYEPLSLSGAVVSPFSATDVYSRQRSTSYAAYAQSTLPVARATRLTLGARVTRDVRTIRGTTSARLGTARTTLATATQRESWKQPTWRVALTRDIARDAMFYVSWDRGFKSGVYNLLGYADAPVDPEVLDAYQAGAKSEWLDRRLRLNVAAFVYEYRNIQVERIVSGATLASNAAAARLHGIEVDAQFVPSDRVSVRGSVSLLNGRYTDFTDATLAIPNRGSAGELTGGNSVVPGDATGNRTIRSPRLSTNLLTHYVVPTRIGTMAWDVSVAYVSRFAWDPDNRVEQSAYALVSAGVAWRSHDKRLEVRLAGTNLTKRLVCVQANATAVGDICSPRGPRSVGLTVSFRSN